MKDVKELAKYYHEMYWTYEAAITAFLTDDFDTFSIENNYKFVGELKLLYNVK